MKLNQRQKDRISAILTELIAYYYFLGKWGSNMDTDGQDRAEKELFKYLQRLTNK